MATKDDENPRKGEIIPPSKHVPTVNESAPATVSTMLSTAFWHNMRFRVAQRMFVARRGAIDAHTEMLKAGAANAVAQVEHRRAWERLDKDLDKTLQNDRAVTEARLAEESAKARLAAMKAEGELERFTAAKNARGKRDSTKPRSYGERFERHFSTREEIYAARDDAIRKIIERAKTQGRDESHPEVEAEIEEARQYAEELISKLRDQE